MATRHDTTVTLDNTVDVGSAEAILAKLTHAGDAGHTVLLDLQRLRHLRPGTGWRIGNALRTTRRGNVLTAVVPFSPDEGGPARDWWFRVSRSGLGYALLHRCHQLLTTDRRDITAVVSEYYNTLHGSPARNHFCLARAALGYRFDCDSLDRFASQFRRALVANNVPEFADAEEDHRPLVEFCFESVQNIADHAAKKPMPTDSDVFDYFAMNWYRSDTHLSTDPSARGTYRSNLLRSVPGNQTIAGFVNIVICDDGVGIPARQYQTLDVYNHSSYGEEYIALERALAPGGTAKFDAQDSPIRHDPGYGTVKIASALSRLNGFAEIRTGRVLATYDGASPSDTSFAIDRELFPYMPGTVLDVLIPKFGPKDMQLDLPLEG